MFLKPPTDTEKAERLNKGLLRLSALPQFQEFLEFLKNEEQRLFRSNRKTEGTKNHRQQGALLLLEDILDMTDREKVKKAIESIENKRRVEATLTT